MFGPSRSSITSMTGIPVGRRHAATVVAPNLKSRAGKDVRVLFVGAGNINFGSEEGPWNHSQRLERLLGSRMKVVGLVDPAHSRAQVVLDSKKLSLASSAYEKTVIYPTIKAANEQILDDAPDLVILGSPPAFRGRIEPSGGLDAEKQLTDRFPEAAIFVEKPISTGSVAEAKLVGELLESRKFNLISVGYMLRYSAAVQRMKEIIRENNLTVMMTSARYVMAYEFSKKAAWWNKSVDCGPIVEQATHFVDLSRFFGGEVDMESIMAHSVEWYEEPGKLTKMNVDESQIPEEDRIPRFTSATWKYDNGGIGHLEHGVSLQGTEFSTEFTVFADGYQLKLIDPYNRPTLYIRRPGSDLEEIHNFYDDDPFLSEMKTVIDMMDVGQSNIPILSSYEDAVKTYDMTWKIRWASEKTRRPRIAPEESQLGER